MSAATITQTMPGEYETGDRGRSVPTVEALIRETAPVLDCAGVRVRPAKLHRWCREYVTRVAGRGPSWGDYLANAVTLHAQDVRRFDSLYYRLTYSDPTGETAVRRVMAGGGAR